MQEHFVEGMSGGSIKVFESAAQYSAHDRAGYWGSVTSTIDWCERNYHVTFYIAEFWNTISNVLMLLLAIGGLVCCVRFHLEMRFFVLYSGIIIVALGSTAFHGTLSLLGQQGDETPMMYATLSVLFCLICGDPRVEARHPVLRPALACGFFAACVAWTFAHYYFRFVVAFQLLFAGLTLCVVAQVLVHVRRSRDACAKQLGRLYIGFLLAAAVLWLADQVFCAQLHDLPLGLPNPQLHGLWHVLVGASCYTGPLFLTYQRLAVTDRRPQLRWIAGGWLPLVVPLRPARERSAGVAPRSAQKPHAC